MCFLDLFDVKMHIILFQLQDVSHKKNLDDSKKHGIIKRKMKEVS